MHVYYIRTVVPTYPHAGSSRELNLSFLGVFEVPDHAIHPSLKLTSEGWLTLVGLILYEL